ncbi:MAG: universal stress protein [Caulobacterales bacterium]
MFRDLLVHVDGSQAGRGRVAFAVDLAGRVGAGLDGMHVIPPAEAPPRVKPSRLAEADRAIAERLAADARAAAAIFRQETAQRLPGARWYEAAGDIAGAVCARARYADMVILGQYEWQDPPHRHPLPIPNSVASQCGRPVLVVPADTPPTALAKIAIAWDGSREAVRAVHDAMPLLRLARSIDILTMLGPSAMQDEADGQDLSAHLAHHGIDVKTELRQIATRDEHGALRREIEQGHCDLLVMGGYSHPMWMEFVFGGATQSILLSSKTPILVSH